MKSGYVDTNGQQIYYEMHGEGEPLILIMDIGGDSTMWAPYQVPAFSTKYQVIVLDNRDAGRSSKATVSYTIADMADDLAGLMDGHGIERAHLLGISMGGMIAQEFALHHPDRLNKLILTGTGGATSRAKFDPIMTWNFVKQHDADGLAFAAQQFIWLFSTEFLRNHQAVDQMLAVFAGNPNPFTHEAYARQAEAYLKHDTLDRLKNVKAPTLVVSGEQDRLAPPWISRELADAIPGAKFHLVKGSGASHALILERPDDFNKIVMNFLGKNTKK